MSHSAQLPPKTYAEVPAPNVTYCLSIYFESPEA